MACTARILEHKGAHRQLEVDQARALGEVGQVALGAAMHRGEGTAQRGPRARGAGAVRWSRTVSCATVTSSRCTAEGGERRGVINVCRPRGISLQAPARLRAPPSPTKRDDQPITFTPVGNEADLTRATRLQGSGIDRTASHVGCMPRLGSPP